jgi:hypothetical protein
VQHNGVLLSLHGRSATVAFGYLGRCAGSGLGAPTQIEREGWFMAKLTGEGKKKFLRERLEEQRHLLGKSIRDLTSGDLAEAVRIATVMRVLVHETGNSTPLLKQLTPNYLELKIPDRAPIKQQEDGSPGTRQVVLMSVPISIKITGDGVFLNPELDMEAYEPSILGMWWTRPCLILPGLGGFSRKEIVLGMADKEGGAHVDTDIPTKYQQLLSSKSFQVGNAGEVSPLNLSRFMVGQAAIELGACPSIQL